MSAISVIIPIRNLDARGFSRLARFAREFMDEVLKDPPAVLPLPQARPTLAASDSQPQLACEVLLPTARVSRVNILQSAEASYALRHLHISGWTLENSLQQALAESTGRVIACCHPEQLPDPSRFAEMCGRLSRADFVAGRRRTSRASKLLLTAAQLPRRAVVGLQRRDPDYMCWVALREAVTDLRWRPAAHRFLAELVAARGFRVTEFRMTDQRAFVPPAAKPHQAVRNLLAAWKLARKTEQAKTELQSQDLTERNDPPAQSPRRAA